MSISSCSLLLLLLLLCLSLHACNAKRLAAADYKSLDKRFHIANLNAEKKVSIALKVESSYDKPAAESKEDIISEDNRHHHQLAHNTQELKDFKAKDRKIMADQKKGFVQKGSLVSLTWRVPHSKHGEKHPGFHLDYSPPKTHPPSHN